MLMRDYIEEGARKAGSLTALGMMLGLSQPNMSHAKAMKTALPAKAVVQLADFIGADLKAVIAANELVTEKDEAKRAFWTPFVQHARAASIAAVLLIVTSFVTPSPAEAAPALENATDILCIMLSLFIFWQLKKRQLNGPRFQGLSKGHFAALETIFQRRVTQV